MALGLTQNASTANQFCVPCCHGAMGRCCTPELIENQTSSLTLTFHNFQQLGSTQYCDIFIDDFSVNLKRADLVSNAAIGLPDNHLYSNYGTGAINITDEGYPEQQLDPPPSTSLYYLASRIVPISLTITRKEFVDNTSFVVPTRYKPLIGYDKNGQYYADVTVTCSQGGYLVGLLITRVPVANDNAISLSKPVIPGLINLYTTFGASMTGTSQFVDYCNPLIAHGVAYNSNAGIYGNQLLLATPALVYMTEEIFINGSWQFLTPFAVIPACSMDWYLTE